MLDFLNGKILGPILPLVLIGAGLFFLIKLRFFIFRHPILALKAMFKKRKDGISPFKAACVALSGTLGVGNIAGVAAAISVGGAGAVFWMWISAFAAMILKYVEVTTAMCYKKDGHGGATYYIEMGLPSKKLASVFGVLILFSSFCVGNIVQSSAAAEALNSSFGITKIVTGTVIALTVCVLLSGGVTRVARFSAAVVPVLSLGYVILALAIIIKNAPMLPSVFKAIIASAFTPSSVLGGGLGFMFNRAMRYGASRGVLSNEAGCGTASFAHSSADNSPAEQGVFGIFEVFVDTVLLCTLTALVVLIAFPGGCSGENGMKIAIDAFSAFGRLGGDFIAVSTAVYALASIVCWSYYGTECLVYFGCGSKINRLYLVLYSATGVIGAIFAPSLVWKLSDFCVSAMAIINTVCLCIMYKISVKCTDQYFFK